MCSRALVIDPARGGSGARRGDLRLFARSDDRKPNVSRGIVHTINADADHTLRIWQQGVIQDLVLKFVGNLMLRWALGSCSHDEYHRFKSVKHARKCRDPWNHTIRLPIAMLMLDRAILRHAKKKDKLVVVTHVDQSCHTSRLPTSHLGP